MSKSKMGKPIPLSTLAAGVLILALAGGAARAAVDDVYEPNNSMAEAWDFSLGEDTWLSVYGGELGVQMDDDWYQIDVTAGDEKVLIECTFNFWDGDIDIELVDSGGVVVAWSSSANDNEYINTIVAVAGTYYIRVYWADAGNMYDLWWEDFPPPGADDAYEPNDSATAAWDFSLGEGQWLSTYGSALGLAIQWNDDWYMIDVQPGYENVVVDCTFTHAAGDIDIELVDSAGMVVAWSDSSTDNENINIMVAAPGTYYILVHFGDTGNTYDIKWNDLLAEDPYEENDSMSAAWDFSGGWRWWLSSYGGVEGIQGDDDWYEIFVSNENVLIDCTFTHAAGNIDIELVDSAGVPVASSITTTDDENIDTIVATVPGTYFIRVFGAGVGGNMGNPYDLQWYDMPLDDVYEDDPPWSPGPDNNIMARAYDFSLGELLWLSNWGGEQGIQKDDDWYMIDVKVGTQFVLIDCAFTHAYGDINIELWNSVSMVASSASTTDNESLETAVTVSGAYYIRVYGGTGGNMGNYYDLLWDDVPPGADDLYEENDTLATAYDFSLGGDTWLADGWSYRKGVQLDDDWYMIYVWNQYVRIDCTFTHTATGNINIELVNNNGDVVATSNSDTDNENINYNVAGWSIYYIRVYGGDQGDRYDLWWGEYWLSSVWSWDDYAEENDTLAEAYLIGEGYSRWGRQYDDDWYMIDVSAGFEIVVIDCTFSTGDIDIQLVDSAGLVIATADSSTPNEHIEVVVAGPGTYYIRVYGDNGGGYYNLFWDDQPLSGNEDPYEPNNRLSMAWDFSLGEGQLLSDYGGALGVQWDDDWYQIDSAEGGRTLVIDCSFSHAAGDIDIQLIYGYYTVVVTSDSVDDNESISVKVGKGTYYIRVFFGNMGNTYDLQWNYLPGGDTTTPNVVSSDPIDAATAAPLDGSIQVTFDEAMDQAATETAFSITPAMTGLFFWSGPGDVMSFIPDAALAEQTAYTVTVGTGATDLAGNALAADYIFTFTTVPPADSGCGCAPPGVGKMSALQHSVGAALGYLLLAFLAAWAHLTRTLTARRIKLTEATEF